MKMIDKIFEVCSRKMNYVCKIQIKKREQGYSNEKNY